MRPSLRFLSLNVNGLRDPGKRHTLFATLALGHWDIVALQETHHIDTSEGEAWAAAGAGPLHAWPGTSFWSHGTTASRGVAVLVRDSCMAREVQLRSQDQDGRLLTVDFVVDDVPFTVCSVYSPCERRDRPEFYREKLLPCLPQHRRLLVGGDFNCVQDALLDQQRHPSLPDAGLCPSYFWLCSWFGRS